MSWPIQKRYIRILRYLVRSYIRLKKAMLKPYPDIQKALDEAIKLIKSKGKKPKIVIMPAGSLTIPMVK